MHPPVESHRSPPNHVEPQDVELTAALAALADPVRLAIVRELSKSPDWSHACGSFSVPIGKGGLSHHFAILRSAGLLEQKDAGSRRMNRLRRPEFDKKFPGLLALALRS